MANYRSVLSSNPDKALSNFPVICNSNERNKDEIHRDKGVGSTCTNKTKSQSKRCRVCVNHERTSKGTKRVHVPYTIVYRVGCVHYTRYLFIKVDLCLEHCFHHFTEIHDSLPLEMIYLC